MRRRIDYGRLGAELAERRDAAGLDQQDVAARIGVSRFTIGAMERGELGSVKLGTVLDYCDEVGHPLTESLPRHGDAVAISD